MLLCGFVYSYAARPPARRFLSALRWLAAVTPLPPVLSLRRLPPREDEAADAELPGVLDRSLFDLTNDSWFANLVRDDYYLAETIYAGGFIACMMMVSQALVRWLLLSPPH